MTSTKHETYPAPRRRSDRRSRPAVVLASTVCALAALPTIATLMMVMLAVASMFNGPHEQWGNALPFLMFPLVYSAAAVMFYKMLRCGTFRKTWLWATLFIVVVGAASTPAVWATTGAVVEEWCESQPGGRGYPSNASSTEVPRACG